jgi:hypothetical protein
MIFLGPTPAKNFYHENSDGYIQTGKKPLSSDLTASFAEYELS